MELTQTVLSPAAQYVRMSTDLQDYSVERQIEENQTYAQKHGLTIIETYKDAGFSGLKFESRPSLVRLIADIQTQRAKFSSVLIYDVSRWGRFQDTDESAFYEFMCRNAGISICYTSEPFSNDGDAISSIMKTIKRVMAAEYSRELSNRVTKAKAIVASKGFRAGSVVGLGVRRMMVGRKGNHKGLIETGDKKANASDRVILVRGPVEEVRAVQIAFDRYVNGGWNLKEIADDLNNNGFETPLGYPIHSDYVGRMLCKEYYVGDAVYGKTTKHLGSPTVCQPEDSWIVVENAYEPIVSRDLFEAARKKRGQAKKLLKLSDEEMINRLKRLLSERGCLTGDIIKHCPYTPHPTTYMEHFNGLLNAYRLVGFSASKHTSLKIKEAARLQRQNGYKKPASLSDVEMLRRLRRLFEEKGKLEARLINNCEYTPHSRIYARRFDSLLIAYELVGCLPHRCTNNRWKKNAGVHKENTVVLCNAKKSV